MLLNISIENKYMLPWSSYLCKQLLKFTYKNNFRLTRYKQKISKLNYNCYNETSVKLDFYLCVLLYSVLKSC